MTNLLIHSMTEFSDIILGCLEASQAKSIVEIGAEFGGMSQMLADYSQAAGGSLTSIDPSPQDSFIAWAADNEHVHHIALPSLDALPSLENVDAWIIDGDHNYYTVYHELKAVDALCQRDGKPLLAFMHDVSWPCARRDMYYAPDRIPTQWLHPYEYQGGVTLDTPELLDNQGFRGMGQFAIARHMGGPRNGVLTAIEDVIAEMGEAGRSIAYAHIPAVFGLGIIFDAEADWAPAIAQLVAPYHDNKLIEVLETNRLRNYLRVIALQDHAAMEKAAAE